MWKFWMRERTFTLRAPPPSHTTQDWWAADKGGYDLNHVFTDSYSQLFPEEKDACPHVFVHTAKLTNTGDIHMRLIANHTTVLV